jgi:hypothetical protein
VNYANDVASSIKTLIDNYVFDSGGSIQYLVMVGTDDIIPFYRVPDEVALANESDYATLSLTNLDSPTFSSLALGYILTDDFYGDEDPIAWRGRELYVPDLATGRLVESPDDIMATINNHLPLIGDQNTIVDSCVVTGYEFLSDSATAISNTLGLFGVQTDDTLIRDDWTASDLTDILSPTNPGLLDPPELISINAHFQHYRGLPAIGPNYFSPDDLVIGSNLIGYSTGCHSGLNVPDLSALNGQGTPDFPQAFAGTAGWVANTGYGYGVDDAVALSEQLMLYFTQELGTQTQMPLGQALVNAKHRYAFSATSGGFGVYDEKAMIESTLYGLPMHTAQMPPHTPSIGGITTTDNGNGTLGGLKWVSHIVDLKSTREQTNTDDGTFYSLTSEVLALPGRPVQPRGSYILDQIGVLEPRGQLLVGATFNDIPYFDPVVVIPSSEDTLPEPAFSADGWFPVKLWAVNHFGDQDRSTLVAGQYDPNTETERLYDTMTLDTYYTTAGNPDVEPPVIWAILSDVDEVTNNVTFAALVGGELENSEVDIPLRVIVTYTVPDENGGFLLKMVELERDEMNNDPSLWVMSATEGPIQFDESMEYYVQAVDEAGNVAISSKEAFHEVGGETPDIVLPIQDERTVSLEFQFDDGTGPVPATIPPADFNVTLDFGQIVTDDCSTNGAVAGSCFVKISSDIAGVSKLSITVSNGTISETFEYITEWWAGSITLPKTVAFGNSTGDPLEVCYTLSRTDGGELVSSSLIEQCPSIGSGNPDHTYEWANLLPGTYQLVERVDGTTYQFMNPIANIVVDSGHRDVQLQSVVNRLEGCSPGFWKNHIELWSDVGLSPGDDFDVVFDFINSPFMEGYGGTLEEAINAKGGNRNALARHGVAALLSALHEGVLYPLEADGIQGSVIDLVQSGMQSRASSIANLLASANTLGCPLN